MISKKKSENVNFLFIASNYYTKGVQLLLKSWYKFYKANGKATLTLVSHDIPKSIEQNLGHEITLIKKAPLDTKLKNYLYRKADVVFALTLTDGVTAIEATSCGKPVVTFRTQHSRDFINNNNGFEVDVPINVYDVDKYGIEWKTNKDYENIVLQYIKEGKFDRSIDEMAEIMNRYCKDRDLLKEHTKNAVDKYYRDHTIENRNNKILDIYSECL